MTLIHPFSWTLDKNLSGMMSWMGGTGSKTVESFSPAPGLVS